MSDELKQIQTIPDEAKAKEIKTQEQLVEASEFLKIIKASQKKVEKVYSPIKAKAYESYKTVLAEMDRYMKPLKEAERLIKKKMGVYQMEQERIRREEERRLQEEACKAEEERRKKKVEETGDKSILEKPIVVPQVKIETPAKPEGVSFVEKWKFQIFDENQIPREFLMVDEKKIGQYVRTMKNKASIPGVKIYIEKETRARLA